MQTSWESADSFLREELATHADGLTLWQCMSISAVMVSVGTRIDCKRHSSQRKTDFL
jgi:hypothetical protein